jgi:hypothetical protein
MKTFFNSKKFRKQQFFAKFTTKVGITLTRTRLVKTSSKKSERDFILNNKNVPYYMLVKKGSKPELIACVPTENGGLEY